MVKKGSKIRPRTAGSIPGPVSRAIAEKAAQYEMYVVGNLRMAQSKERMDEGMEQLKAMHAQGMLPVDPEKLLDLRLRFIGDAVLAIFPIRDGDASEFAQGLLNPSRDADHMIELSNYLIEVTGDEVSLPDDAFGNTTPVELLTLSACQTAAGDEKAALGLAGKALWDWGGSQRWLRSEEDAGTIRALTAKAGGHATLFRGGDRDGAVFHPLPAPMQALQRRIKQALDPRGLFNPGRLYADW